ncbi:MAG: purS, partial [Ilumatobacteraceae bacterium]|nr:purS [Ilumatobacteraceae bacterium]
LRGGNGVVPAPDPDAPNRYRRLHAALMTGRIAACHDVSEGGVAVAVAEMAIGGRLGATVDLTTAQTGGRAGGRDVDQVTMLFGESTGRFVCELADADVPWLVEQLAEPVLVLGRVTVEQELCFTTAVGRQLVTLAVATAAFSRVGT